MNEPLLEFRQVRPGILSGELDLAALYPDPAALHRFHNRCEDFLRSHGPYSSIFDLSHGRLLYNTEQILPPQSDPRPPLVLLLGNPASHSVHEEMFFSFEAGGREHRFWRALAAAGLLTFPTAGYANARLSVSKLNQVRRQALLSGEYESPFRVGLVVYFSIPSSPSGSRWAGVAGLCTLFGTEAMRRIGREEAVRVEQIVREFVTPEGAVLAFQKDAYTALKAGTCPEYSLLEAWAGRLIGRCRRDPGATLLCCPPTRFMNSPDFVKLLKDLRDYILGVVDGGRALSTVRNDWR